MQSLGITNLTVLGVPAQESTGDRVVVSGAQVVEAKVGISLFAAIEIVVWRGAGRSDLVSEGVVFVDVRYCPSRTALRPLRKLWRPS